MIVSSDRKEEERERLRAGRRNRIYSSLGSLGHRREGAANMQL